MHYSSVWTSTDYSGEGGPNVSLLLLSEIMQHLLSVTFFESTSLDRFLNLTVKLDQHR